MKAIHMSKNILRTFLVAIPAVAFAPFLASSRQSNQQPAQQSQAPIAQFGLRQRMLNPVPIPPDARPPDRLLQGATVSGTITALAFSPDSKWLAWSGYDDTIVIWNSATGAEERKLTWPRPANTPFTELTFNPDGTHLTAIAEGKVKIWDLRTGKTSSIDLHARILSITYSPDGKAWAAITFDPHEDSLATIEIRDAGTGKILRTIPTKWWGVTGVSITHDGQLVAAGTVNQDEYDPKGNVQVWDLASGNLVKTSSEFGVVGQLSPDGRFMAAEASNAEGSAANQNPGIVVTDLSTGQVKWTFRQSGPAGLFFSPDSTELAVTNSADQGLTVYSLVTGAAITSVAGERDPNEPGGLTTVAFSPDGKRLAAAPYPTFSAKIWDVASGHELCEFAGQFAVQALAMSPDGKWLVSAAPGVTVEDSATGKVIRTLTLEDADMLLFSPDGHWLAANPGVFPGGAGRSLEVWDTKTWTLVANVTPPRDPRRNAPVTWFAFGNAAPQSKLGYAESQQFTADGRTQTVWFSDSPLTVSPDGKLLAETGHPTTNFVDIWDTSSGQEVKTFSAHDASTNYLAFSTDGRCLLTLGQDYRYPLEYRVYPRTNLYKAKVWDVATWKETTSLSFPAIRPFSALLSPDGHRLAVERSRQRVDLFDADNGNSLGAFAIAIPVTEGGWSMGKPNLAFSPDGALLFQGAKGRIRVWSLPRP
jgi:WD40 repeat protein